MTKDYIEREAVLELLRYWADGYSYIEIEAATATGTAINSTDLSCGSTSCTCHMHGGDEQ